MAGRCRSGVAGACGGAEAGLRALGVGSGASCPDPSGGGRCNPAGRRGDPGGGAGFSGVAFPDGGSDPTGAGRNLGHHLCGFFSLRRWIAGMVTVAVSVWMRSSWSWAGRNPHVAVANADD